MDWGKVRGIYNKLGDELSKDIFENRLVFSATGDMKYIRRIIEMDSEMNKCAQKLYADDTPIAVFGAGVYGKHLVHTYDDIEFTCFIDNKATGPICGLPVYSLENYIERFGCDGRIVIAVKLYHEEIYSQLIKAGYHKDNIINIGKVWEKRVHDQYIDLPQLELVFGETRGVMAYT